MTAVLHHRRLASPLVVPSRKEVKGGDTVRSDSRCTTATLLAALTTGLSAVREPRLVRQRFEEQVRSLLHARSITFREGLDLGRQRPHVISLDVPGPPTEIPVRLEAIFDPSRVVDDWARELLGVAAQVAGLLFEIERTNGRWPLACAPRGGDGAAPLIGSSPGIRKVRERIEKVAATDFTALIEGGSGPQPHRGFIEVSREAAVDGGPRAVAGTWDNGEAVARQPGARRP